MDSNAALALAPLIIALVGFVAYCLVDIVRHEVRVLPKWVWAIITVASVPLGGILYLVLGRGHDQPGAAAPPPVVPPPGAPPLPPVDGAPPVPPVDGAPPVPPVDGEVATASATSAATAAPRPERRARPAPEDVVVRTAGLRKDYPAHPALDGVDLVVPRGSVYGLVGPNGSGKTTLLSLLSGLRRPTGGSIELDVDPTRIAVLPDTPTFDAWLTGREVVDLARSLTAPQLPASAVDDALARTGLVEAADRRVGGYSRGMLQRLGLAATVIGEPELLLLDEPCSALDPLGRREVLDLVGRLGGDATVLFCSHILGDVQEVCDTVGVLKDGRLLFQGSIDDLLVGHASAAYTIRVRGGAAAADVAERLGAQPWVVRVERPGAEELRVTVRSLEEAEAHLVGALAASGSRVVTLQPAEADLEHVFLELTR